MTLRAKVIAGRLVFHTPTDLPEGTEVELLPVVANDWLDDEDRDALHASLDQSDDDVKAGRLVRFENDRVVSAKYVSNS